MASSTPTTIRGLIVPDPRVTSARLWAAESTYTEAGPIPGVADAQQATGLALHASGAQSSGTLEVRAQKAGASSSGAFVWKASTDGPTNWRGWDVPSMITRWEGVDYEAGTGVDGKRNPSAVTLSDGRIVVATCTNNATNSIVYVHRRSAAGVWSAPETVHSEASNSTYERFPALVLLPSGRLICFSVTYTALQWYIRADFSDDGGDTWAAYSPRVAAGFSPAALTPTFLKAAYSAGEIVMFAGYNLTASTDYSFLQYASTDLGGSFTSVGTFTSGTDQAYWTDVVGLPGGGFVGVTALYYGTINDLYFWAFRLGSAFQSATTEITTSGSSRSVIAYHTFNTRQTGNVGLCVADDGSVYAVCMSPNADNTLSPAGFVSRSSDGGVSWSRLGADTAYTLGIADQTWWYSVADAAYPTRLSATWHRGRVFVLANTNARATTPSAENALYSFCLGGYSNLTLPSASGGQTQTNTMTPTAAWAAIETPANAGYAGTGTASTDAFDTTLMAWRISTTDTNYRQYTASPTLANETGAVVRATLRVDDGSGVVGILTRNVGASYQAEVSLTTGSISIVDVVAGAAVNGISVSTSSATWYEMLLVVENGQASAWFRAVDAAGEDREWTIITTGTLTDGGAAGADSIYFGRRSTSGTATSYWREAQYGTTFVAGMAAGFANPGDLRGRQFATSAVYVDGGTYIAAAGGSAAYGDEWDIVTDHRYSIDRIHPREYPSPSQGWRSTGTTAETIAWKLTDETTGGYESDVWGLYLDGTNIPQGKLQYTTVTTPTWTDASSFNLYEEFSGVRSGSVVMPDTAAGASSKRYIERDELVGGSVKLSSGDVRAIIRNDEGYLGAGTVGKRVRIYLDESQVDPTDGTSGTFELRFPRGLFAFNSRWATSQGPLVGLRLALNTAGLDAPPEGYWQAGVVVLGPMAVFGTQYSATRRRVLRGNTSITTSADGRRRSRVNGAPRQVVDVAWTEGVDETWISGTTQDDYVLPATSREPVAAKHDAIRLTWGLARELDFGHVPVVYVPEIGSGSASTFERTAARAGGAVYGRVLSDPEAETLLGDEGEDELVRGSMTIEEEV